MLLTLRIFSYKISFYINRHITVPRGVSSRIPHTLHHVLYLDYDNVEYDILEDEIKTLMVFCELGNMHIIRTSERNYHVECHGYFLPVEVLEIQDMSSCDALFRRGPKLSLSRGWIHRRSEKGAKKEPEFVKTLESPFNGDRLQSSFHNDTLNTDFDLEITLVNPDELNEGYDEEYETLGR